MFLGIVLAVASGLGAAFLLNVTDSTVRGAGDVVALTKLEPFAHVPTIRSQDEVHRRRFLDIALAGSTAGIALLLLLIVA
jgi:hypothetical protein